MARESSTNMDQKKRVLPGIARDGEVTPELARNSKNSGHPLLIPVSDSSGSATADIRRHVMSASDSIHAVFDRLQEIERHEGIFLDRDSEPERRNAPVRLSVCAPACTEELPAIESAADDDPRFIAIVRRVLEWSARCEAAKSIRVVRIDN